MGLFRDNEPIIQTKYNNYGEESQLAGGKPVGYLHAWPRIWTRDYWEQIQLVVRAQFLKGWLTLIQDKNFDPILY